VVGSDGDVEHEQRESTARERPLAEQEA